MLKFVSIVHKFEQVESTSVESCINRPSNTVFINGSKILLAHSFLFIMCCWFSAFVRYINILLSFNYHMNDNRYHPNLLKETSAFLYHQIFIGLVTISRYFRGLEIVRHATQNIFLNLLVFQPSICSTCCLYISTFNTIPHFGILSLESVERRATKFIVNVQ